MASTRQQLQAAYAAALLGIILLFAATIWLQRASRLQEEENRREQILAARADTVAGVFSAYVTADLGGRITTTVLTGVDSTEEIAPVVRDRLQQLDAYPVSLPNYIAVFALDTTTIFASSDLAALGRLFDRDSAAVGYSSEAVLATMKSLWHLTPEAGNVTMDVFGRRLMLKVWGSPPGVLGVSHYLVGTDVPPDFPGLGQTGVALVVVSIILVLVATYFGYSIASRSLKPVEQIINEAEAITDGRSLHKRVAVEHSSAELARLAATLNAMMERLEISFTALRTFTADASHELNTPLAVLRADVERAMQARAGADEQLVALEEALREIRRMSDLVGSLLTLARADEGRLDMLRERVDLAALTQDVYETAQLLGEDAQLTVKLTTLERATVLGDHDRLRQLFLNLVSNAIKYTPAGGRVELSLSERLDGIAFSVKDTGIGISQTDLAHIFERFWRADHSRSRASGTAGFGLGLPIGHWIAQAHGGTLTAASKMGKGSTFTVTLPYADGVPQSLASRVAEHELRSPEGDL